MMGFCFERSRVSGSAMADLDRNLCVEPCLADTQFRSDTSRSATQGFRLGRRTSGVRVPYAWVPNSRAHLLLESFGKARAPRRGMNEAGHMVAAIDDLGLG